MFPVNDRTFKIMMEKTSTIVKSTLRLLKTSVILRYKKNQLSKQQEEVYILVSILDHEIANRVTFDTSSCLWGGVYQGQPPPPQALRFSQGRREGLVMSRKEPWEGYRRQAKHRLAHCLLPAFLCAYMFIERERETSGYEAVSRMFNRKIWRMRHP